MSKLISGKEALIALANSEDESKEIQELFFELGYTWSGDSKDIFDFDMPEYIVNWNNGYITVGDDFDKNRQEITLPELRDLVVLKRNDVGDASHINCNGQYMYEASSGDWYLYHNNAWKSDGVDIDDMPKPIEKPMKEYLRKNNDGEYILEVINEREAQEPHTKHWIEIPEGCNIITCENRKGNLVYFHWKSLDSDEFFLKDEKIWSNNFNETLSDFIKKNEGEVKIIWSHHTHPEELPFIDDEPLQSLNDQYAEIEKVRQTLKTHQSQYGSFEDVAMITEQMVDIMRKGYYEKLAYNQKMALYMICSKMARIVNGNPNHKDSWYDIAGYATLIDNELESEKDMLF